MSDGLYRDTAGQQSYMIIVYIDKVKCELQVASCELQKLTLYHNICLQSFSTLKIAF